MVLEINSHLSYNSYINLINTSNNLTRFGKKKDRNRGGQCKCKPISQNLKQQYQIKLHEKQLHQRLTFTASHQLQSKIVQMENELDHFIPLVQELATPSTSLFPPFSSSSIFIFPLSLLMSSFIISTSYPHSSLLFPLYNASYTLIMDQLATLHSFPLLFSLIALSIPLPLPSQFEFGKN